MATPKVINLLQVFENCEYWRYLLIYCTCLSKWSLLWAKLVFIKIPVVSCSEGTKSPFSPVILHRSSVSAVLSREIIWKLSTYKTHLLKREGVIFRQTFGLAILCFGNWFHQTKKKGGDLGQRQIMPKTASLWSKGVIYWRCSCRVSIWQNSLSWRKTIILIVCTMKPLKHVTFRLKWLILDTVLLLTLSIFVSPTKIVPKKEQQNGHFLQTVKTFMQGLNINKT